MYDIRIIIRIKITSVNYVKRSLQTAESSTKYALHSLRYRKTR